MYRVHVQRRKLALRTKCWYSVQPRWKKSSLFSLQLPKRIFPGGKGILGTKSESGREKNGISKLLWENKERSLLPFLRGRSIHVILSLFPPPSSNLFFVGGGNPLSLSLSPPTNRPPATTGLKRRKTWPPPLDPDLPSSLDSPIPKTSERTSRRGWLRVAPWLQLATASS